MLYIFIIKHTGSGPLHVFWMPSECPPATLKWSSEQKVLPFNIKVKICPHVKPGFQIKYFSHLQLLRCNTLNSNAVMVCALGLKVIVLKYGSLLDSCILNHIFNATIKSSSSLCQCKTWNNKKGSPVSFYSGKVLMEAFKNILWLKILVYVPKNDILVLFHCKIQWGWNLSPEFEKLPACYT